MSRVMMVHGWGGSPRGDWFPWVKDKLEKRGFKVVVPEMPDTEHPRIETWVPKLKEVVGELREDDILIGHSVGCQTILRVLPELEGKASKVILVAPWGAALSNLDENEEEEIARPWLEVPIDFTGAREKVHSFIAIFSIDDPYVPFKENSQVFKEKLGAKIVKVDNMSHFHQDAGIVELPVLLNYI